MELEKISQIEDQSSEIDAQPQIPHNQLIKRKLAYRCLGTLLIILASYILYRRLKWPFQQQLDEQALRKLAVIIPHDTSCYTQGLSFVNSTHILESCGLYKSSYFHLLQYTRVNGQEARLRETFKSEIFDQQFSLEGSVYFPKNKMIYILTWRQNVVFRFDAATLKEVDRLSWKKPGRGLTHNNSHLIVSDGSSSLFILNEQLAILQEIKMNDEQDQPFGFFGQIQWINEKGRQYVLANVSAKKQIVKIDLSSGKIVNSFEFDGLVGAEERQNHYDEMNGIAYNGQNYLLTGKKWSSFYQITKI